jgi:zinc/manganese transport system substrate-binding protein
MPFKERAVFKKLSVLSIATAGVIALSACATPATPAPAAPAAPGTQKLNVVATFSILADLTRNVAGDKVTLETLVGAGSDTHDFEPAPSDAAKIANANVIIENGVEFETWLDPLITSSGSKATRIVASSGITLREGEAHHEGEHKEGEHKEGEHGHSEAAKTPEAGHSGEAGHKEEGHGHGESDPHVWQDVQNVIRMVGNIEAGLSAADPVNAPTYKANAAAYVAQLTALDTEIKASIESIPAANRKIVTSHDALGYFGARYGIEIVGEVINALSTEAGEPSAKEVAALIDAIKAQGVKALFLESITNPALVERVATESGTKVGGELYTDALSPAGGTGATYIDAMRHNVKTLTDALK